MQVDLKAFEHPILLLISMTSIAVMYSIALGVYTFGWRLILNFISNTRIDYKSVYIVFSKSNIAKYIPGNVANYVSRNIIGNRFGWNHKHIALSSILEVGLVVCSSVVISLALGFEYQKRFLFRFIDDKISSYSILFMLMTSIIVLLFILKKKTYLTGLIQSFTLNELFRMAVGVFLAFGVTLVVFGISFVILLFYVTRTNMSVYQISNVIGMYMVSWAIGYLTPGSPGGLGVRESILIISLSPIFGHEVIAVVSILHRLACIIGDILSLAFGLMLERQLASYED